MFRKEPTRFSNSFMKNVSANNVSTSSDFGIIKAPEYKIIENGDDVSNTYILNNDNEISLSLLFKGVNDDGINFDINIHKYDKKILGFNSQPIFTKNGVTAHEFNYNLEVPINKLIPDGEYILKLDFYYPITTKILSSIGLMHKIKDSNYSHNKNNYFTLINEPEKPEIIIDESIITEIGTLFVENFKVVNETNIVVGGKYNGNLLVTLSGKTLTEQFDYIVDGQVINFITPIKPDDLITVSYSFNGKTGGINSESIKAINILSGPANKEGLNKIYYNTDTNKFEIFSRNLPIDFNKLIITVNGFSIMNGIDFYQSKTNNKKIIFNGLIKEGDLINIFYNSTNQFNGNINSSTFDLHWSVVANLESQDGYFDVLVTSDPEFKVIEDVYSIPYQSSVNYNCKVNLIGNYGDKFYLKVRNRKNFKTINLKMVSLSTDSDVIPIMLMTNTNNSY